MLVQTKFWLILSTKTENNIISKNLNHQHLRSLPRATESQGLMRFPHQYPPPRPRPLLFCASTAALASRSRSTTESWPSRAAQCSGVLPREPQPEAKPRAEPNGTKGEKVSENFGHLKSRSFGNFGHSKILPGLKEHCGFEMFWWHRVGWKNCCLWILAVKMTWIMNQNIYSNSGAKSDPKVFISSYFYKANWGVL